MCGLGMLWALSGRTIAAVIAVNPNPTVKNTHTTLLCCAVALRFILLLQIRDFCERTNDCSCRSDVRTYWKRADRRTVNLVRRVNRSLPLLMFVDIAGRSPGAKSSTRQPNLNAERRLTLENKNRCACSVAFSNWSEGLAELRC